MASILESVQGWIGKSELPSDHEFFEVFAPTGKMFVSDEDTLWDFKETWPHSYSDKYFGGIARTICAFSNTYGGIIIFGVHDTKRTGGHNRVFVNTDKLKSSINQLTGQNLNFQIRHYSSKLAGDVDVILIPQRPSNTMPIHFLKAIDKYPEKTLWVRLGHEVVQARPRHYPALFCRADNLLINGGENEIGGILPPSPSTISTFVGRNEVLYKLFDWLLTSNEPRKFLWGRGGSGKTAIAYEFAKLINDFGRALKVGGKRTIDQVIFLSAKERKLITATAQVEGILDPDFSTSDELIKKIIIYSNWMDEESISKKSNEEVQEEIKALLDNFTILFIIDDIDTLTTKAEDGGFDFLYGVLYMCASRSKVLYTLRNAPSHSILNSIEVPGLSMDGEYSQFVDACVRQFNVPAPTVNFRDVDLVKISDRRPLLIEAMIALRRSAESYDRAASLFNQHAGSEIRDYVFAREWDALQKQHLSRELIIALAELNRPADYGDLETVLDVDSSRISDAIGAVREMFLQVDALPSATMYSLAPLTRKFALSKRDTVSKSNIYKTRVQNLNRKIKSASPEIIQIMREVDKLCKNKSEYSTSEEISYAWKKVTSPLLEASVTEDPIFRTVRGYVASCLIPPKLTEAREDFLYAKKMKVEPDFFRLKAWRDAEKASDEYGNGIDQIAEIVFTGKYKRKEVIQFMQFKATHRYFRGYRRQHTEPTDAYNDFRESLLIQLKIYKMNMVDDETWAPQTYTNARNCAYHVFNATKFDESELDVIDYIKNILNGKIEKLSDIYIDPIEQPAIGAIQSLEKGARDIGEVNKLLNKMKGLDSLMKKSTCWAETSVRDRLVDAIKGVESGLYVRRSKP